MDSRILKAGIDLARVLDGERRQRKGMEVDQSQSQSRWPPANAPVSLSEIASQYSALGWHEARLLISLTHFHAFLGRCVSIGSQT